MGELLGCQFQKTTALFQKWTALITSRDRESVSFFPRQGEVAVEGGSFQSWSNAHPNRSKPVRPTASRCSCPAN